MIARILPIFALAILVISVAAQRSGSNPHGKLAFDCELCHTTGSWEDLKSPLPFNHDATGFSLMGAHRQANCTGCHRSLVFSEVSVACADCHQDVHAGRLGTECQSCHMLDSWSDKQEQLSTHADRGFPLTGVHAISDCAACHTTEKYDDFKAVAVSCRGCHEQAYLTATNPDHKLAAFSADCEQCHHAAAGTWNRTTWQHPAGFALTNAHHNATCVACHATKYAGTSTDCYSCHQPDYATSTVPNHAQGGYPTNCIMCHTTVAWTPASFDHATTSFPLTGAHASAQCQQCHVSGYAGTSTDCYACHQTDFANATTPNHVQSQFPHTCTSCHNTVHWSPSTFDHSGTGFTLTGAHTSVACISCHASGYAGTPTACYSCHQSDYAGTSDPNHQQAGFSTTCTQCHTTASWGGATYDHAGTGFPLTGAHVSVECKSCHITQYAGTSTDCNSCHNGDYTATTSPNHAQNGFPTTCQTCHSTTAWTPSSFDHGTTGFALTGAHTSLACLSCHSSGFAGTPTDCYACHQTDFAATNDPNHQQAAFPTTCAQCHTTASWSGATYDHATTGWALTGWHVNVRCAACHTSGYAGTSTDCNSCHANDYAGTTNPNHALLGFPTTCETCHSTSAWSPSSFDHNSTGFALTGKHTALRCLDCHSGGYQNTPSDCYSCHQTDFAGATDPNHVLAGFATTCTNCHTTSGWTPSSFNHSTTGFTLTGAHTSARCVACHATQYAGTSTLCYSCHQSDYTSAVDPNHVQGNYPQTCELCHSTTAWQPATFDHSTSAFPLTGAHTTVACIACHASGYTGTPTACYACHQTAYNATNDPNHAAAHFPTTCQTCHNTTAWIPSSWNHDTQYFPINSGAHATVWSSCATCHVNLADYAVFECINCHQHNKIDTDGHHVSVIGYQYNSIACYTCHPRGTH